MIVEACSAILVLVLIKALTRAKCSHCRRLKRSAKIAKARAAAAKKPTTSSGTSPSPARKRKNAKERVAPKFLEEYEFWYSKPDHFAYPPGWKSAPVMSYSKEDLDNLVRKIEEAEEAGHHFKCGIVKVSGKLDLILGISII